MKSDRIDDATQIDLEDWLGTASWRVALRSRRNRPAAPDTNASAGGRRSEIYAGAERMTDAIKAVEGDDQIKAEIINALSVVIRLALTLNNGGVSPQKLPNW